ncbi:2117_t:CDS:2, partial [Racocetra fulgida]
MQYGQQNQPQQLDNQSIMASKQSLPQQSIQHQPLEISQMQYGQQNQPQQLTNQSKEQTKSDELVDAAREREEDTGCCLCDCLRISFQICIHGVKEQVEYDQTEEARRARAQGF